MKNAKKEIKWTGKKGEVNVILGTIEAEINGKTKEIEDLIVTVAGKTWITTPYLINDPYYGLVIGGKYCKQKAIVPADKREEVVEMITEYNKRETARINAELAEPTAEKEYQAHHKAVTGAQTLDGKTY